MLHKPTIRLFINEEDVGGDINAIECSLSRNLETITDTASALFPSTVHGYQKLAEQKFRRSNYAEIVTGWEDQEQTEFKGFVSNVHVANQVRFNLWDFSWLFRITKVRAKTFGKTATAQDVFNYLAAEVTREQKKLLEAAGVESIEVAIDESLRTHYLPYVRIMPDFALHTLMRMQDFLPYPVYFRDNVLCLWRRYRQDTKIANTNALREITLVLEEHTQAISLEYFHADDRDYEIQCQTITPQGELITGNASAGLSGGQFIRLHYPWGGQSNETLQAQLRDKAAAVLELYTRPGFEGLINAWIAPRIDTCTHINLIDKRYPTREGTYYVNNFVLSISANGTSRSMGVTQIKDRKGNILQPIVPTQL